MKFNFSVGDVVKLEDGRHGEVLKVLYDSENGVRYQVAMNSVDFTTNEIIPGFTTQSEEKLEKYVAKE